MSAVQPPDPEHIYGTMLASGSEQEAAQALAYYEKRFGRHLRGIARSIAPDDWESVLQNAYGNALNGRKTLRPGSDEEVRAWLQRIVRNAALDETRRRSKAQDRSRPLDDANEKPWSEERFDLIAEAWELKKALNHAMEDLGWTDVDRRLFVTVTRLCAEEGSKANGEDGYYRRAAELLCANVNTVKANHLRLRREIREHPAVQGLG